MRSRGCRSVLALCLGVSLGSLAGEASADTVAGSRSEKLVEQSHILDVRIDRGSAKLVVRRTFFNGGARHDQAMAFLNLPSGAVATGLRTLGVKDEKPFWFAGELMEAEAAAAKYRELTGIGGYYPKDPALLSWRSQDTLALQVFPCAPQQPKTVEYTLEMPTSYRGGRHHLILPKMGTDKLSATAIISAAREHDSVFIDEKKIAPGTSVSLDKDELDIGLEPLRSDTVEGALSSVVFGLDRALVGVRLEVAPKLSAVPRGAHVVVVMDTSMSMSWSDIRAESAAARAYLSSFKDASVSVMTFDRDVKELQKGRFVSVRRAIDELEKTAFTPRNGSRLDAALARADELLRGAPPKVAKRIVVMTDLLTREGLDAEAMKGIVKSGAIVHVGIVDSGRPELNRDDDDEWAALPRSTGGVLWRASASDSIDDTKQMAAVFEEWARPVRIHKAKILVQGSSVEERQEDDVLNEGEGFAVMELRSDPVVRVEIKGELWATPYRKSFSPSDQEARLSAALVFGSSLLHDLKESEMMGLAMLGRAVTPVTSYLAIEPGVRPSTEGLDWSGSVGQGFGSGFGRLGGIGTSRMASTFDHAGFLSGKLKSALRVCGGGASGATVSLETTLTEIVHVSSVSLQEPTDPSLEGCFTSAIWDILLPGTFRFAHKSFTISI